MLILALLLLLTTAGWLINRSRRAVQRQKAIDRAMYHRAALAAQEARRIDSDHFSRK